VGKKEEGNLSVGAKLPAATLCARTTSHNNNTFGHLILYWKTGRDLKPGKDERERELLV